MKRLTITQWCQKRIREMVESPEFCIDATAGTGRDTVFLCSLLRHGGRVLAMDVQEQALEQTRERLKKVSCEEQVQLVLDGHQHMDRYCDEESADLIMFNLGYLPGGDHNMATTADTTLEALDKSLRILKEGGLVYLMIYSGGDTGFEEKNAVMAWLKELDSHRYTVLVEDFYNKPNHPPLPVFIWKR